MASNQVRRSHKAGKSPGTLIHIGERKIENVRLRAFNFDRDHCEEHDLETIEQCNAFKDKPGVSWINLDGIHEIELLESMGRHFGLHPLTLEDILNTGQRPKLEDYDDYLFIVLKMLQYDEQKAQVEAEQISIIVGKSFVLSFQESEGDVFDPIRQRICSNESRIRKSGPDYLFYRLLDTIVDHYFVILEKLGERIERLEDELTDHPTRENLHEIYRIRRELISLRKSIWPTREIISALQREEFDIVKETTTVFLRDVYDHTIQVIDTVEIFRDTIANMLDIYMSSLSNRMNEIMKVLTIIATIFIPLTFVVGIYGMNFSPKSSPWNMPELNWYWGYPATMLFMALVAALMLVYFKRKNWL